MKVRLSKKRLFSIFGLLCFIVCMVFSLTSCTINSRRLRQVKKVASEVDYSYQAIGNETIVKDFEIYNYVDYASKILGKEAGYTIYSDFVSSDYMYYLTEYDSHGGTDESGHNTHTFDIGLFRITLETCEFELLYDFKDVYPRYNYTYAQPDVYHWVNDDTLVFYCNGKLEVFDTKRKEIISKTTGVYNHEYYRTYTKSFPFEFVNDTNDYAGLEENKVRYYEFADNTYKYHEYEIEDSSVSIKRYKNLVYTMDINGYTHCFDLTTDESVSVETLEALLKEEASKLEEVENRSSFTIDGVKYSYSIGNYDWNLKDIDGNIVLTIDEDYMLKKSKAFKKLYNLWTKSNDLHYLVNSYYVVDNKLFVSIGSSYGFHNATPSYIYEVDIKNDDLYYVGFSPDITIDQLRISSKN